MNRPRGSMLILCPPIRHMLRFCWLNYHTLERWTRGTCLCCRQPPRGLVPSNCFPPLLQSLTSSHKHHLALHPSPTCLSRSPGDKMRCLGWQLSSISWWRLIFFFILIINFILLIFSETWNTGLNIFRSAYIYIYIVLYYNWIHNLDYSIV